MKNSEILTQARKLIENEANWTRYTLARNPLNEPVDPTDPDAVCFCSIGSIGKVTNTRYTVTDEGLYNCDAVLILNEALGKLTDWDNSLIWSYNDRLNTSHEFILAVFDKAIELAKAEETE